MSTHSSLKSSKTGAIFRSVLKRYEKIKDLTENEKWDEKKDSIFSLPKVKRIKFKIRKTKSAEGEGEEGKEGAGEAPAAAQANGAKP